MPATATKTTSSQLHRFVSEESERVCLVAAADLMAWSRLQGVVRAAGLKPVQVRSPEAIQAFEGNQVAAIVVDLSDPATGVAAVEASAQAHSDVPLIAIGPHVDRDLFARAKAAGADPVMPHSAVGPALAAELSARTK